MKTVILPSVVFVAVCTQASSGSPTNVQKLVERWLWYPKEMVVKAIPAEQMPEIVAELRKHAASKGEISHRDMARYLLLRLGDEETMAEVVKEAQKGDSRAAVQVLSVFNYVYNPAVIPAVAELLYYPEEPAYMKGTGLRWETRPLWAASKICEIIRRRDEFTQETRAWAASARFAWEKEFHQAVRQFWEQNREAFLRKDYAAVKPLQPASAPALSASPAVTNAVPQPPPTTAVPVPKPEPVPAAALPEPKPSAPWLPWLAGAAALVLIAVVVGAAVKARRKPRT